MLNLTCKKEQKQKKNKGKNEKSLYKLINNAVHGKAMGNVRNKIDVRLINNVNGHKNRGICHKKIRYLYIRFDESIVVRFPL